MQLLLTGVDAQRPILAIKAVRAVTDLGLREAKEAVDRVRNGGTAVITVIGPDAHQPYAQRALRELADHGVSYTVLDHQAQVIVHALRRMPYHLTVREILDVASALGL
jgi:Ribosomal protein L7/L12 C-terminal domain